jgi:membrane-anchored glycerophosphoryl diester phosphodiesterase (GDPDase)
MHLCLTKHLISILWEKGIFNEFFVNMYSKLSIYGAVFFIVYFRLLVGVFVPDSQALSK